MDRDDAQNPSIRADLPSSGLLCASSSDAAMVVDAYPINSTSHSPSGADSAADSGRNLASVSAWSTPGSVGARAPDPSCAWNLSSSVASSGASVSVDSAASAATVDDPGLEWAIRESIRESEAQQEAAAAQPGAHIEAGVIVPPDMGSAQPLTVLIEEYTRSDRGLLWHAKLQALSSRYTSMRRARGDGNCFYRSLWMGWMERLMQLPATRQDETWKLKLPITSKVLSQHLPVGTQAEFDELTGVFVAKTRELCQSGGLQRTGAVP